MDFIGIKNYLYIAAGIVLIVGFLYFRHVIIENEDNRVQVKTDKHIIAIKGKQNEIRNNTPDAHAVAVSMRAGLF